MTREEAIEKLELTRQKVDEETYRALILAIKTLEQQPCDDAISREDAIAKIYDEFMSADGAVHIPSALKVLEIIRELPSVTPSHKECRTLDEFIEEQKSGAEMVSKKGKGELYEGEFGETESEE